MELPLDFDSNEDFLSRLESEGPQAFIVPIDPGANLFPEDQQPDHRHWFNGVRTRSTA